MMWEEWRYPPQAPQLGDYVQVEGPVHTEIDMMLLLRPSTRQEGIVTRVEPCGFNLSTDDSNSHRVVHRWRRLKLPEYRLEKRRVKEIVR